jgi:hypothetical protein
MHASFSGNFMVSKRCARVDIRTVDRVDLMRHDVIVALCADGHRQDRRDGDDDDDRDGMVPFWDRSLEVTFSIPDIETTFAIAEPQIT